MSPQHPLHSLGLESPKSPQLRDASAEHGAQTPLGMPDPRLPVGASALCSSAAESAAPARAPLWPPRPTPAPGPESLGPRERRRHDAPSMLQPLPNAAGSGPGTIEPADWSPLFHRGIPVSPPRVQRSQGCKWNLACSLPSLLPPPFSPSLLAQQMRQIRGDQVKQTPKSNFNTPSTL